MKLTIILIVVILLLCIRTASASTYLPVEDEAYSIIQRLEAEGIIQDGLLTTRPLSYKEIIRLIQEAERNSEGRSAYIKAMIKSLKRRFKEEIHEVSFIKPLDTLYGRYIYLDSGGQELNYNNDGDLYNKGSNLRAGFTSRADLRWLSLYLNPEFRYSEKDSDLVAKRVYGILNFLGLEIIAGKDSQWWGPGYHGAILLSNNAEPFTMLRITNPQPVILPSLFKYLGPFRFNFFVTKLEKERTVPEPYLWGMRLNFKPFPYLEIGLERTALLGGKGRSEALKAWLKSFTGSGENISGVEAGDQRAGVDIKLTLPFKGQPLQIYGEANGEDEAGGLPYKWAMLAGIYLPRLAGLERLSLRAEYANTHVSGAPNVWYTHHIYGTYTYKGMIIGHHIGTDSEDIFLEVSYYMPKGNSNLSMFYDREVHNLSGTIREKKDEFGIRLESNLTRNFKAGISYQYGNIKNAENIKGYDRKLNQITGMVRYEF